ncbi:MAG: fatty acid desaturase [Wenzhouxiangellaceae bacterium]
MLSIERVRIPSHFYERSLLGSLFFISYALLVHVLPLALIVAVYLSIDSGLLKWLLIIPLAVIAGQGLHLMGWVGHEGFHNNLARNKTLSMGLALLVTGPIGLFSTVGENSVHWNHHKYTNGDKDLQTHIFPKYRGLLTRLIVSRLELEYIYLRNMLLLAFDKQQFAMAVPHKRAVLLARIDLVHSLLWLALYGYVYVLSPGIFWAAIALPHTFAFVMSSIRPYVEHAGTGDTPYTQARTMKSKWMSLLLYFNNYHLEHHLYPAVPCWKLPALNRYLTINHIYDGKEAIVSESALDYFRCSTAAYQYPEAQYTTASAENA